MFDWVQFTRNLVSKMGFADFKADIDKEHHSGSIVIYDAAPVFKEFTPLFVESINHLSQILAQKHGITPVFYDVNNYRKEREKLLTELARAAARKAVATRQAVSLPAMNSYERRVIHLELAGHPEVVTESQGGGRERFVIVKLVGEGPPATDQVGP